MKILLSLALGFAVVACQKTEAKNLNADRQVKEVQNKVERMTRSEFRYEIAEIADFARPFVVSINTEKEVALRRGLHPFEEFFFGPQQRGRVPEQKQKQQGLGSGVLVSDEGYILTNNHVVEGADGIKVRLFDEREFDAKIVGLDEKTDLAVIKIEGEFSGLPTAEFGDSDTLRVGEWVVAIGSPFGLNHTVTTGIVSAKNVHNRGITSYENFIQTDAAINPGNSGGALLDLEGKLVGINTAILSRSGGFQGIGFAIPVNMAQKVMGDLIAHGKVSRGWLGVSIQDLDRELSESLGLKEKKGVLVSQVLPKTPAAEADVRPGDVIYKINQQPVETVNKLRNVIAAQAPESKVKIHIYRAGKSKVLTVTLGSLDGDARADLGAVNESFEKEWGLGVEVLSESWRKRLQIDGETHGVVVTSLAPGGVAQKAGLQVGDLILKLNQKVVGNLSDLKEGLDTKQRALLWIQRGDSKRFVVMSRK